MNAPGVGYALQKGEAIAHEERYQLLTQKVAYLFKGVPLSPILHIRKLEEGVFQASQQSPFSTPC